MLVSLRLDTRWEKFWNIAKLDSFWKASIRWHSAKILGSSPQSSLPCRSARQNMPQNYAKKKTIQPTGYPQNMCQWEARPPVSLFCQPSSSRPQCSVTSSTVPWLLALSKGSNHLKMFQAWVTNAIVGAAVLFPSPSVPIGPRLEGFPHANPPADPSDAVRAKWGNSHRSHRPKVRTPDQQLFLSSLRPLCWPLQNQVDTERNEEVETQ